MLKGRLGLESARIPHIDRHGLLWLGRGQLYVAAGTLRFRTAGDGDLERGDYALPFQMVSCLLLQPGTSASHDAFRLLARHGTCLVCVGEDGVRFYASLPAGPDTSARARRQMQIWSAPDRRIQAVLQLYAWRLGEVLPATDLDALRGIEGARMKETYRRVASQFGIEWHGRRYDRAAPLDADVANQAINHAASAVADWFRPAAEHAVLMTWPDSTLPGGQAFQFLGTPLQDLYDCHGIFLSRRDLNDTDREEIKQVQWDCAHARYLAWRGFSAPLSTACEIEGIAASVHHRAAPDARKVWALLRAMQAL
jgi:CRISPR-associated endonuclease Cas1 subtype I-E